MPVADTDAGAGQGVGDAFRQDSWKIEEKCRDTFAEPVPILHSVDVCAAGAKYTEQLARECLFVSANAFHARHEICTARFLFACFPHFCSEPFEVANGRIHACNILVYERTRL